MQYEQIITDYLDDKGEMFVTEMRIPDMLRSTLNSRLSVMAQAGKINRRQEWHEGFRKKCWMYSLPNREKVYKGASPYKGEPEYAYILRNFFRAA